MRQQDNHFTRGNAAQRAGEIGGSAEHIIHAGKPEAGSITLNRYRLIRQNEDSLGLKCACDALWVSVEIVIAQDRPQAVRRGHLAQEASAWFGGGGGGGILSNQRRGNEVSRERDQVGPKPVDYGD